MTLDDALPFILEKLTVYLKRPVSEADLHQSYASLGTDSMDMVALAFELEKFSGLRVVPEIFLQYDTITDALGAVFADGHVSDSQS
jgi:acyl carrier protein